MLRDLRYRPLVASSEPVKVVVLGAGQWGAVLSTIAARNGHLVQLIDHNPSRANQTQMSRTSLSWRLKTPLPAGVRVTSDFSALQGADLIILTIPSSHLGRAVGEMARVLGKSSKVLIVHGVKGLIGQTGERPSQVIAAQMPKAVLGALAGPNLASEIDQDLPAACVVASKSRVLPLLAQRVFATPLFRVYSGRDLIGVELCGALKNVLAVAAGAIDKVGLGKNTSAMVLTRGVAEISGLVRAHGGKDKTVMGLAGIGDILATCASPLSRNFRAGELLADGLAEAELLRRLDATAEGITSMRQVLNLAREKKQSMPIVEMLVRALDGKPLREAIVELLSRPVGPEFRFRK